MLLVMARIDINEAFFQNNPGVIAFLERFSRAATKHMQIIAAEKIESRTGNYNRSFYTKLLPGALPSMLIGNSAEYAIHLEEGTVAHRVAPVKAQALRWFDPIGGGEEAAIFSKGHVVGPIPAMHIVRDGILRAAGELQESARADRLLGR